MVFRWIVNAGLLAIPIGTTIGVLVGIDAQRQASGQQPLFSGGDNGGSSTGGGLGNGGSSGGSGGGSGGTIPDDNGITFFDTCELSYGINPPTEGQNYTMNPNQWGVTDDVSGMCMNVTVFNNGTYATNATAPQFYVTWNYTDVNPDQPVHAFPNIAVDGDTLPIALKDLKTLHMDVDWTYAVGNEPKPTTDTTLDADGLNANVAIDMFLDEDKKVSADSSKAKFEIMIWFAKYGPATDPIGYDATLPNNGRKALRTVNGTEFELYYGQNGQKQNVITYISTTTTPTFSGELQELLTIPTGLTASQFPAETDYLGHFSFGSEAFTFDRNITFSVSNFAIDIRT